MFEYFTKHKLFYDSQYGFRTCHSTELAINELVERVLCNTDNKRITATIFMDLSKAFDMLNHRILINKLQYYGIRGTPLQWFISYLSDRTQFVNVNDVCSTPKLIEMGVPQGSILGPLSFLIYMNDISLVSNHFDLILYADDTTLLRSIEYSIDTNDNNPFEVINDELHKMSDWLSSNRLSLNVKKTKYMLFHTHQKNIDYIRANINLNEHAIKRVDTFNFLGGIPDKHMSWKTHTEMLSNKISKYCGIMTRLKNYLPLYVIRTLYFSMLNSHLNYGLLVWGYECNRLIKVQKRGIRIITRSKYSAHTKPLLKGLEILNLPDMLFFSSMKFYYRYKHKKVPSYFYSFRIVTQWSNHNYNTRQRDDIRTNRTRLHLTDKCLRNYLPGKINTLPEAILNKINTHSLEGFALAVKKCLLNQYPTECTEIDCYVSQRHS